ncbi:TM2 domain-containing protein [Tessaracoccus rhinocerotis]|uniref:TM2 domain-containing protein n=2 Tax=Tessaracoccus rhinocerotis TaxID=1689449 RepID=A0A553K6H9_9ACTN|nr:TM2 domain-containing protein [Tessaracoccus rhinocerotis]
MSYRVQSYPQAPAKSKVAAALLAFFLGGIGAHSFYLGRTALGLGHLALAVISFLLMIGGVVGAGSTQVDSLLLMAGLGYLLSAANSLWALVDFIIILAKPESELGR